VTRTTAMAASLTAEQRKLVAHAILRSFDALGPAPKKLAELVWYLWDQCKGALPGSTYELHRWCEAAVQRLKREGSLELVRGAGGGWKRGSRKTRAVKASETRAMAKKTAKAKKKVPAKKPAVKKAKKATAKPKKKAPVKAADVATPASYAPFTIDDFSNDPAFAGRSVRLSFFDWEWLEKQHGSIELDGYYMNGPGVEGLVQAVMFTNKIDTDEVEGDSEGDACLLYFPNVKAATRVAQLAAIMMKDRKQLAKAIEIARDQGFED
jgi:hypothetical protein